MTETSPKIRAYSGPAILSFGFRPFFLAGALWAAIAVAIWLPLLDGHLSLPSAFTPLEWHVHELLYGFIPAIITGFLLTAVPNWTGRLPVAGWPLAMLATLWVAGRIAIFSSSIIGPGIAALVDLSFLATLGLVILRELIAGKTPHHLRVLAIVGILLAGNITFHFEATMGSGNGYGTRIGIAATVLLIVLIGGRIVPSFTRNWLAKQGPGRLPVPFGRFDAAVIATSALGLASWIVAPDRQVTAALFLAAAVLNTIRLARWAGDRTAAAPIVTILHLGFAFIPLGFFLMALAIWSPRTIAASGALHSWTAGAFGVMTLAVMTRASLGHTGRPLEATRSIQFIYFAVFTAAIARLVAAFGLLRDPMLHFAATAWVLAFVVFVAVYAPLLTKARA